MKSEELKKHSFMGDTAFSIERLPAGKHAISNVFVLLLLSGSSLYDCRFPLTLREERRLRVFENRVLRRVFGSKRGRGDRGMEKSA
jgi:hypothetical protein